METRNRCPPKRSLRMCVGLSVASLPSDAMDGRTWALIFFKDPKVFFWPEMQGREDLSNGRSSRCAERLRFFRL